MKVPQQSLSTLTAGCLCFLGRKSATERWSGRRYPASLRRAVQLKKRIFYLVRAGCFQSSGHGSRRNSPFHKLKVSTIERKDSLMCLWVKTPDYSFNNRDAVRDTFGRLVNLLQHVKPACNIPRTETYRHILLLNDCLRTACTSDNESSTTE